MKVDSVAIRLKRVEGQVQGIARMYTQGRPCLDMVQQIVAVRAALAAVGKELLGSEAAACSGKQAKQKEFDSLIKTLFDIS